MKERRPNYDRGSISWQRTSNKLKKNGILPPEVEKYFPEEPGTRLRGVTSFQTPDGRTFDVDIKPKLNVETLTEQQVLPDGSIQKRILWYSTRESEIALDNKLQEFTDTMLKLINAFEKAFGTDEDFDDYRKKSHTKNLHI